MTRRITSLGLALAATLLCAVPASGAERAESPVVPTGTHQLIVVRAASSTTTRATVTALQRRADGGWEPVVAPTPARIGSAGLVPGNERRQLSNKTPSGLFALEWAFGRAADPGTSMRYVHVDRDDAWTYNPRVPSTYNVFQDAATSWSSYGDYVEHLWDKGGQYDYVVVLDFNLPTGAISRDADGIRRTSQPANTRRGGGIFLHVDNGRSTAGCVSVPRATMARILRWLDPAEHPMIAIGTSSTLVGLPTTTR